MQGSFAPHLIKRGVLFAHKCLKHHNQAASNTASNAASNAAAADGVDKWISIQNTNSPLEDMSARFTTPMAILLLGLTLLAFLLLSAGLEYAIRLVATNLAIVEDTGDCGRIALRSSDDDDLTVAPLSKSAAAGLLGDYDGDHVKQSTPDTPLPLPLPRKPITRNLRATFHHLSSVGGFSAKFRGVGLAAFYQGALFCFTAIFSIVFAIFGPLGMWMASTAAAVVCCNLHATWTHATISASTNIKKPCFQQFLPRKEATKLILPTLRLHMTVGIMHAVVIGTTYLAVEAFRGSKAPHWISANVAFLPIATGILAGLLLVVPSYIALIRSEAALLPSDTSAIVPFDRTFGGRMTEDVGVHRCRFFKKLSVRGAWTLFSRDTYKRTLKMQIKFVGLLMLLVSFFGMIFAAEAYMIAGGKQELNKLWVYFQASRQ